MDNWTPPKAWEHYEVLAPFVRRLPEPTSRFYRLGISTDEMPPGTRRLFNMIARDLPGGCWHMGYGRYFVTCSVFRWMDPARATTAWRDLPPPEDQGPDRTADRALRPDRET